MSRKLGREEVTTMVTELVDNESDDMWDIPTSFFLLFDRPTEERTGVMLNEDITILFMKHPEGGPARLLRTVTTALMIPFAPDMPHGLEDGDRLIGCMLRNEGWGL